MDKTIAKTVAIQFSDSFSNGFWNVTKITVVNLDYGLKTVTS